MRTILFISLFAFTAHASFYHPPTQKEYQTEPDAIPGYSNPSMVEVQPFSVPDGYVAIPGTRSIVWDGTTAQETYQLRTQAEQDALDQAAQAAQLQAIVDQAGDEIRDLEAIIDYFEIERPVSKNRAIAHIEEWQAAKGAAGDVAAMVVGNTKSLKLLALFDGLSRAGIEATIINAVWTYMGATGQQGGD